MKAITAPLSDEELTTTLVIDLPLQRSILLNGHSIEVILNDFSSYPQMNYLGMVMKTQTYQPRYRK